MKLKTTLILLAVVVAVALFIKFGESKRPNTEEALRQSHQVLQIESDQIDGIQIQNGDERTVLRRNGAKWRLETPIKDQADNAAVAGLISDLADWTKERTITAKEMAGDKAGMTEFGLTKPKLRLKLFGKNAPPEILFGKEGALEGRMYVRFENSRDVFIAAQSVRNDIARKAEDFRDRKLTELTTAQVARLALKTPAGEMELEKKADHWEIVKPLRARADDQKVNDLVAQFTTARIMQFVASDDGDLHPYGLAEPRGAITLFPADDKQGAMLQIGSAPAKMKDQIYVRFAPRHAVYTLAQKVEDVLALRPDDLRDRHLIRFDDDMLDRVTIEAPGKTKTVLARNGEKWTIANHRNQAAAEGEVHRLLEILHSTLVTKFVSSVASDLAKYGLDHPQLQVTLSSFASENTAETKAGERPFATIVFGKEENGNVYARLDDEPFIVAVKSELLGQIFANPVQWHEVAIFHFKPEQVHRLAVTTDQERSITRGPNEEWKWVTGSGEINPVNVRSMLNTLASLRAVQWIGPTIPAHGLEKPQITITFTTSPDDKAVHKLALGASNGNSMWFAHVDGRDGTFLVSNPDMNAFRLPLTKLAPPSPSPSPTAETSAAPVPSP